MPNTNPYKVGDDIFQQYDLTRTVKIKTGVAVTKGEIYTKDTDGYLVALTAASGNSSLVRGAFQAKDSVAAVTYTSAAEAPTVQVLVKGAWIIMQAPADVVEGQLVSVAGSGTTPDSDKVKAHTSIDVNALGRVYQILTVTATTAEPAESRKLKTANNDLIVIQTGVL